MSYNPPIFTQHDRRWQAQRLGTVNGATIGAYGCLVTCLAMMYDAFSGASLFPNNVDDIFTNQGGYAQGDLVIWGRIPNLLPGCAPVGSENTPSSPANIDHIKQALDAGELVILEVRWHGNANMQHYVLAVAYNGNDIIVNDPETGTRVGFSSRLFGTGNSATDIISSHYFANGNAGRGAAAAPAPAAAPAAPPHNPEDDPMTADQEKQAYEIVLGREPEGGPTGRTAWAFINDARAELNADRAHLADVTNLVNTQGSTIANQTSQLKDLTDKLSKTEAWQHTYKPDRKDRLTVVVGTDKVDVIDFNNEQPNKQIGNDVLIEQAGTFIFDGVEYARTVKSEQDGVWYGVPTAILTPGTEPSSGGPGTTTPEQVAELHAQAQALSTNQQFKAAAASQLGSFRSWFSNIGKTFGGQK